MNRTLGLEEGQETVLGADHLRSCALGEGQDDQESPNSETLGHRACLGTRQTCLHLKYKKILEE